VVAGAVGPGQIGDDHAAVWAADAEHLGERECRAGQAVKREPGCDQGERAVSERHPAGVSDEVAVAFGADPESRHLGDAAAQFAGHRARSVGDVEAEVVGGRFREVDETIKEGAERAGGGRHL
jgi:hypothetical protein